MVNDNVFVTQSKSHGNVKFWDIRFHFSRIRQAGINMLTIMTPYLRVTYCFVAQRKHLYYNSSVVLKFCKQNVHK